MVRKSVEKTFNAMLDVRDYWYRAVTSTVETKGLSGTTALYGHMSETH